MEACVLPFRDLSPHHYDSTSMRFLCWLFCRFVVYFGRQRDPQLRRGPADRGLFKILVGLTPSDFKYIL
jgi:phosphatidylserine decarboxylase